MLAIGAKRLITRCVEAADEHASVGDYDNSIIAVVLLTSTLDRLLSLEYARMGKVGTIACLQRPTMKQKCDAVVTGLRAEGFSNSWIDEWHLSVVVPLGCRARHQIYPRIEPLYLGTGVAFARGAVRALFEHYYGEALEDRHDEDYEPLMSVDALLPFVYSGIRRRISGLLIPDEMTIYDLLETPLIAGAADWISLRRANSYNHLLRLGESHMIWLQKRIHTAALADAESIVGEESLRVFADLKSLIAAEAHSVRMRRPSFSIPLSDAQIAVCSILKRFEVLLDDEGAA